jgi:hypothetical protein
VVLHGSESFDVELVVLDSLAFGPGGAPLVGNDNPPVSDINDDGFLDLFCKHAVPETGIAMGDVEACLTGETNEGVMFEGCAPIRTTPEQRDSATRKAKGRNR